MKKTQVSEDLKATIGELKVHQKKNNGEPSDEAIRNDVSQNKPVDQHAITVIAPIDPLKLETLRQLVKRIRDEDIERNTILPFLHFEGVHFCRFLILSGTGDIPDQLVYASNFDASEDAHIAAIKDPRILPGFEQIFSCCLKYNPTLGPESVPVFIRSNKKKVHTFYRGHRGLSLDQIRLEDKIYTCIQHFLDATDLRGLDERKIKDKLKDHVENVCKPSIASPEIRWRYLSIPSVAMLYLGVPLLLILGVSWLLGVLLYGVIFLLTSLMFFVFYLRRLEKNANELSEDGDNISESQRNAEMLTGFEDFQVQNQLSHLVELRPGFFRRRLQLFALAALNKLALLTYNKGRLGDIGTIHFARWSLIDNGKRLLFFSNFDGSWENYLGDFVDRAAVGLTLAWSNTKEFPKTKFLIFDGATNEELFKTWTRKNQIVTNVWYTAYKHLTVKNILRNHKIALGLRKNLNDNELKEWLKLL